MIYPNTEDYPKFVSTQRGALEYSPMKKQTLTQSIESIPQVIGMTYSYYQTQYSTVNEVGLGIGESSASTRLFGSSNTGIIISIDELSRIAMERSSAAREEVLLIRNLAGKFGFYGEITSSDASPKTDSPVPRGVVNKGGEVLTITHGLEGFVFQILSDGESGAVCEQYIKHDQLISLN